MRTSRWPAVLGALVALSIPTYARADDGKIGGILARALARIDGATLPAERLRIATDLAHPLLRVNAAGEFHIYLSVRDTRPATLAAIEDAGARIERVAADLALVECRIAPHRVRAIAALPAVSAVHPVDKPILHAGGVMTAGDAILRADVVRALGHDGSGIRVGVISDDVDNLEAAQVEGELPRTVRVLSRTSEHGDEGTALLEIVHDIAPGAELLFASGSESALAMREAIFALAGAGCRVVVDDVGWLTEPMFADGFLAHAVDEIVARGVVYVSAAGNGARSYYSAPYAPVGRPGSFHAWDGVADTAMAIAVEPGKPFLAILQWAYNADDDGTDDYDLVVATAPDFAEEHILERTIGTRNGAPWYNAIEQVYLLPEDYAGNDTLYLAVDLHAGMSRRLGLYLDGVGWFEHATPSGSIWGHAAAKRAIAVGAINATDPGQDDIAPYSARGPVYIDGDMPETRLKPDVVAIDRVSVSGVGEFGSIFAGTSAAAAHVAGIAALLLDASPEWTAGKVAAALVRGARDCGPAGPDPTYGYGLVQADAALAFRAPPRAAGRIAESLWSSLASPYAIAAPCTVAAGDTLVIEPGTDIHFSSGARLVVAGTLVAAGTATDSIRFFGDPWGGIRVEGGIATFAYARISGCRAERIATPSESGDPAFVIAMTSVDDESPPPQYGPFIHDIAGANSAVAGIRTFDEIGGGIVAIGPAARISLFRCVLRENGAGSGGGVGVVDGASAVLSECLVDRNVATERGGGAVVGIYSFATFSGCTFSGNRAGAMGGAISEEDGVAWIRNTIAWDNLPTELTLSSRSLVTWSDVRGGWPGQGNIGVDPLFVGPVAGNYTLAGASPCINAGDPASPREIDGTRADIGAFPRIFPPAATLIFPKIRALPGDTVAIAVRAVSAGIASAALAFTVDTRFLQPLTDGAGRPLIRGDAFRNLAGSDRAATLAGDTVRVRIIAPAGVVPIAGGILVELAFVADRAITGDVQAPLAWLRDARMTSVNGVAADLVDGSVCIRQPPLYGDVSRDGRVTAYDASLILQYVIGLRATLDDEVADVTVSGHVSSYDAALVMRKSLSAAFRFPAEGDLLDRPATARPRALTWVPAIGGWLLAVDDASAIEAGQMVIALPCPARVIGHDNILARWADGRLHIAFTRQPTNERILFRLEPSEPLGRSPFIEAVEFNEGLIPLAGVIYPAEFTLSANVPNPFNPTTVIRFHLPATADVALAVYDVTGRSVRMLVAGRRDAGLHEVVWDGCDAAGRPCASGVYLYRLAAPSGALVRRMTLAR